MVTGKQLDLMSGLMVEDINQQRFIDAILYEIKNVKYLRRELETMQSLYHDTESDFTTLSSASNCLGNVLYFLASLAYRNSTETSKFRLKGRDWFYDKIVNKGLSSAYNARSPIDLYYLSTRTQSALEGFILANQKRIDSEIMNNRLVINALDSFDNAINYLKDVNK